MSLEFGKLNFYTSFNPASAFPLDARSYFESYDAAVAAAASAKEVGDSTTTYYYGQTIAVVEDGVASMYIINPDGTLGEVGGKVEINENVFAHDADGKLNLFGFADAVAGAQLMKVDGKLAWIKPDQTTVEGLQATVEGLVQRVEATEGNIEGLTERMGTAESDIDTVEAAVEGLQTAVGAPAEGETAASGLFAELDKKANASDVYTTSQTDTAIATAVAGAAHLQRTQIDSVDAIDPAAEGAEKTIFMVAKEGTDGDHYDEYMVINGAVERVGDWAVDLSEYAKSADIEATYAKSADVEGALGNKVDKVEGSRLMSEDEGTKLEGIEAGAQVNKIESADETQFALDENKNLTLLDIAMGKVTGLVEELDSKVDAAENARLMLDEEGTKLEGIEAGAQVNKIDAVSSEFVISADGKELSIAAVEMSKVTGLPEALVAKVDAVEGKGLSTNDLTDELVEKINSSDANVLEIVKVNGTALEIASDKSVDIIIPVATADVAGTVKSATGENKVAVAEDGTMEVDSININKIVQTEGDTLILNGGAAGSF